MVTIDKGGYTEDLIVPKADRTILETSVNEAVKNEDLWLISGPASIWSEDIPPGLLNDESILSGKPSPISTTEILPESLSEAWKEGKATAIGILSALSVKTGKSLPWKLISEAIDGAIRAKLLELSIDSAPWPCGLAVAQNIILQEPATPPPPPPSPPPGPRPRTAEADLTLGQIQDFADLSGDIQSALVGYDLKLHLRMEISGKEPLTEDIEKKLNEMLKEVSEDLSLT